MREITFNVEKPYTEEEIRDFKAFRQELKSLLKKGRLKVVEKFRVFAFIVVDLSAAEEISVASFLKKENRTLVLSFPPAMPA